MLNVIDIPGQGGLQDPIESGLIFPVPGPTKNAILMEERDGEHVQRLTATAVEFKVAGRIAFRDRNVKIDLFITDARFALACSKYDKGGGWNFWGGGGALALDTAFNAVSKARASLRSRGKMLVGQVRYPWLLRVGSSPKTGWASNEKLVLETSAGKGGDMRLTLTLPKQVDAARVAWEIARRAASYRIASEDVDPASRAALDELIGTEPLSGAAAQSDGMRFVAIPGASVVGEESARIVPRAAGGVV